LVKWYKGIETKAKSENQERTAIPREGGREAEIKGGILHPLSQLHTLSLPPPHSLSLSLSPLSLSSLSLSLSQWLVGLQATLLHQPSVLPDHRLSPSSCNPFIISGFGEAEVQYLPGHAAEWLGPGEP
jgi:hypothetical protein